VVGAPLSRPTVPPPKHLQKFVVFCYSICFLIFKFNVIKDVIDVFFFIVSKVLQVSSRMIAMLGLHVEGEVAYVSECACLKLKINLWDRTTKSAVLPCMMKSIGFINLIPRFGCLLSKIPGWKNCIF